MPAEESVAFIGADTSGPGADQAHISGYQRLLRYGGSLATSQVSGESHNKPPE